jgi:hypothetical protein
MLYGPKTISMRNPQSICSLCFSFSLCGMRLKDYLILIKSNGKPDTSSPTIARVCSLELTLATMQSFNVNELLKKLFWDKIKNTLTFYTCTD